MHLSGINWNFYQTYTYHGQMKTGGQGVTWDWLRLNEIDLSNFAWWKSPTFNLHRKQFSEIRMLQAAALLTVTHAMQSHKEADWQLREPEGHETWQLHELHANVCGPCHRSSAEHPPPEFRRAQIILGSWHGTCIQADCEDILRCWYY